MAAPFTVTREGAVAVLTHDDGKANTFVQPVFEALLATLDELEQSDATSCSTAAAPATSAPA